MNGTPHFTCPVCGAHPQGKKQGGVPVGGDKETDFMPLPQGGGLFERILTCVSCGYSGFPEDYQKNFKNSQKKEFIAWDPFMQLGISGEERSSLTPDQKFHLGYLSKKFFGEKDASLGEMLLHASWAVKYIPEERRDHERASFFRKAAIGHFKRAAEDPKVQKHDRMTFYYLVAELSRREGLFDQAVIFFDRFLSLPSSNKEWMRSAVRLLELSMNQDASSKRFSEFAKPA